MTTFEDFFADEWQRLLESTRVPRAVMAQPADREVSWDRRAAWLYFELSEKILYAEEPEPEPELTDDGY